MFTGLVQDVGTVVRIVPGATTDLVIRTALGAADFALGESIAVDGACLTVVERTADAFRVQAGPETLRRTTLGALLPGSRVHLERALRLADRLGGHLVLGHVDAVAPVLAVAREGGAVVLGIGLSPELAPLFIEKGSVAVDGVSLTVNSVGEDRFGVALIPETQARTTLAQRSVGTRVNIEADVIGKYVARLQRAHGGGGLTLDVLRASGFISES
ncbi:MAG TPA: riboflavin synthase [Myxococcaceae bacterium]|jgi:riboflavin synthase|nr:riboflavin synthase [Myxococcaceae bacterium]